jgi:NTE family protein
VLRGLADSFPPGEPVPFPILTGVSAGAINAVALGSNAEDFRTATSRLWDTWAEIDTAQVFRTDASSIASIGFNWLKDLALGGLFDNVWSSCLLDTSPLRRRLGRELDFPKLARSVQSGRLDAVAVSATNYGSGASVTFFDSRRDIAPWTRMSRVGIRERLSLKHVMASSAIPGFFPPEPFGETFWGDGCVRQNAPLSPAIHLGADAVLAIGIRRPPGESEMRERAMDSLERIAIADVAGLLLNAVFLDSLESDLERMERINRTLSLLRNDQPHPDGLRVIPVHAIMPSVDLGQLAREAFASLPRTLRYMLSGLGASDERGWDLVSYLAFDPTYTQRLLELGRADAKRNGNAAVAFIEGTKPRTSSATMPLNR